MGADGHIDIANLKEVEQALTEDEFRIFWQNCPNLYKHNLDGREYLHVYYDYSNCDYPWDIEVWRYYRDTPPEITQDFVTKIQRLFHTSWEVWT